MRADSKAANSSKSMEIMDVNPQAVVDVMERHHVQWLIHGHTHRPAVHELQANGQPAWRVVLGAWHSEGSMVKVTPDDVELIHFRSNSCASTIPILLPGRRCALPRPAC
jgi:UDP-2,3-diacylglucosamine hydrolase